MKWHLSIYGEGPDRAKLASLIQNLSLSGQISFRGWQNPADIWPHTDLLIFPSIHEGLPNAVLEALADHVPVMASDIPAHRNILPSKTLIPLASRKVWLRVLEDVIGDPATTLKRMKRRQAQFAAGLVFDWDENVAEMIVADRSSG